MEDRVSERVCSGYLENKEKCDLLGCVDRYTHSEEDEIDICFNLRACDVEPFFVSFIKECEVPN